jgi:AcrR family transcriptional regulator
MPTDTLSAFEPRKTPVQTRAAVTVEAISEATIQVLLSLGGDRLTTTRVAERAGVSAGTLYEYYPNQQSMLFAVLENHLGKVTEAVELACKQARNRPLSEMIRKVVEAFVDAKMERADIAVALYQISANVGGPALLKKVSQQWRKAIEALFHTAPDVESEPERFAIDMMLAAISGVMRYLMEAGASHAMVRKLREHLVLLCQSYMAAATAPASSEVLRQNSTWRPSG